MNPGSKKVARNCRYPTAFLATLARLAEFLVGGYNAWRKRSDYEIRTNFVFAGRPVALLCRERGESKQKACGSCSQKGGNQKRGRDSRSVRPLGESFPGKRY